MRGAAGQVFGRLAVAFGGLGFAFVLLSGAVDARPVGCADIADDLGREAVQAAEAHVKGLWLPVEDRLAIAYRLKGETGPGSVSPPNGGGGLLFPKPATPQAAASIEGVLVVEKLGCSIFEIGPPRAYVVGFRATGLIFKEGSGAWSPRIADGLIHALAVRRLGASWVVSPMPGARTSLPEDAVFNRPAGPMELPTARRPSKR